MERKASLTAVANGVLRGLMSDTFPVFVMVYIHSLD